MFVTRYLNVRTGDCDTIKSTSNDVLYLYTTYNGLRCRYCAVRSQLKFCMNFKGRVHNERRESFGNRLQ